MGSHCVCVGVVGVGGISAGGAVVDGGVSVGGAVVDGGVSVGGAVVDGGGSVGGVDVDGGVSVGGVDVDGGASTVAGGGTVSTGIGFGSSARKGRAATKSKEKTTNLWRPAQLSDRGPPVLLFAPGCWLGASSLQAVSANERSVVAPSAEAARAVGSVRVAKALVIVESPAKAKTIAKYLGKDFIVESSIGHVRDLPSSADEIPEQYKKKAWARTGVDVENDFTPLYIVPPQKKAQVQKLKNLLADADALYLATDEDREGEAIAWHLREVLKPKVPVKRMVFHEITEAAIKNAIKNPRQIDQQLVDAQEARRILDRLYGYEVSPILWKKVAPRLSAGRVQSVATRLIVERERMRRAFVSGTYWGIQAQLVVNTSGAPRVYSEMIELALPGKESQRLAKGVDFDPNTGKIAPGSKVFLLEEAKAKALEAALKTATFTVSDVTKKPFTQKPAAPFTTSTLQQEAARKLRFTAQRTMRTAQRLYENGFITYMRTDSTTLSEQALAAARGQIEELYGKEYVPSEARKYATKSKGAQEAHEAIRPAGETFRTPDQIKADVDEDAFRLYDLIWKRTVASQMKDATGERTQVRFDAKTAEGTATFQSGGKVIHFPGFLRAYVEGSDDPDAELEEQERVLPPLEVKDTLKADKVDAKGSQTQPPARYTEASLVKELEDRGIGRPSTFASIIQTIQDRGYVFKKGTALVPTFTAFAVINLLEQHFGELVDYAFTASMETDLDAISEGEKKATPWLNAFYFGKAGPPATPEPAKSKLKKGEVAPPLTVAEQNRRKFIQKSGLNEVGLKAKVEGGTEDIDPRTICELQLGKTADGKIVAARVGRFGAYVQIGEEPVRPKIPDDVAPDELTLEKALQILKDAGQANKPIGQDPVTKKPVYVKSGRFGPYVQMGDMVLDAKGKPTGEKPRMASLWPGMTPSALSLEEALLVLSFPKVLGKHENGLDVVLYDGKFGPYVAMEGETKDGPVKETRSLTERALLTTLSLQQALDLLKQPRVRAARGQQQQAALATLGTSTITGQPIAIRVGRFGAYVTDGQVNATIPSSKDPLKVTLEEAFEYIAAREGKMREQGLDPRPAAKGQKPNVSTLPKKAAPQKKAAKTSSKKEPAEPKAAPAKKAPAKKAAPKKAAKKATKKASKK
jgi:DNA topoisomerase-1